MIRNLIAFLLLTSSHGAFAELSCAAPLISAVPIMSPFALAGLSVVLALVGIRVLRNRR